jgi:hypothetical protein
MTTSDLPDPDARVAALVAVIEMMNEKYPPSTPIKFYPISTTTHNTYTVNEVARREMMMNCARKGLYEAMMTYTYRSGIPHDELAALVALIYC